ncbi:MAG TPA: hypothetical protein PK090_01775 [Smithellaceae bacterium]|nr:hypothetical protein [Smithellaceae bacterium]
MPSFSKQVAKYQYEVRAINGENAAFLYLFDADNKLLCMAAFVERTGALPGPREHINGAVILSFYRSDLEATIDMLRNEKPVIFNWSAENRVAQITTGPEPVGEEEGRNIASLFAELKKTAKKRPAKKAAKKPAPKKKSRK